MKEQYVNAIHPHSPPLCPVVSSEDSSLLSPCLNLISDLHRQQGNLCQKCIKNDVINRILEPAFNHQLLIQAMNSGQLSKRPCQRMIQISEMQVFEICYFAKLRIFIYLLIVQ